MCGARHNCEAETSPCPICRVKHKHATKVYRRHQRWIQLLNQGRLPCDIPGLYCRPEFCSFHQSNPPEVWEIGADGVCNHHLHLINVQRHKIEVEQRSRRGL